METGGAIVVVVEIVFAGPEEFDGDADLLGDGGGFEHVIVGEAAAETTTGALEVNDDVARRDVQNFCDELAAGFGSLAGRPEFEFAVVVVGEAIFGLHGGMCEERIEVSGFDGPCGVVYGGIGVAVFADGDGGSLLGELIGAAGEEFAALLGGRAFIPGGAEFFARGVGLPPGVGDDGNAAMEAEEVGSAVNGEGVADAGLGFDFVEIGAEKFTCIDGAFFVDGIQHAGNFEVDAVERFSGDDGRVVDAVNRLADDFVIFGILELDGFEIRCGKCSGFFRERAVSEGAVREGMDDAAGGSLAFGFRDGPGLRGGGDEHLAAGGANTAKRIPVDGSGGAASGALRAVNGFVEVGLLDADGLPIDVELVGDDHGEAGLDALTDFRILADDGDGAVGGDADESGGQEGWNGRLRRLREKFRSDFGVEGEEESATGDGGDTKEGATIKECSVHRASSEIGYRTGSGLGRSEVIVTLKAEL